ncbi:unnamed protein product [Caenorhabditis angaria]|uniref:F-box domain-containing protein n=1 Tax=Caenorhabditis angaria TaxID=860376 RepID=A0A9P1IN12_9PELO|nr:unnamed protein product [Caenorhabditis angaria]
MIIWNDLPFELKLEVFQYLTRKERLKFGQCSFSCLKQVLQEEKEIESLTIEKITRGKKEHNFQVDN